MKRVVLHFLLILNIGIMSAQTQNYLPGYVITLEHDTLRGKINFKTDEQNAKVCYFRANEGNKEYVFSPAELISYRFLESGKYYVSRKVSISGAEKIVFLEYLIRGLMSVYYYKYDDRAYYFFEKEDGQLQMVTKEDDKIVDNMVVPDKRYDGELRYLFQSTLPEEYKNKPIDYNQKTIIGIAKKYHQALCTSGEECIVYENKTPDAKVLEFELGVYGGLNCSEYAMNGFATGGHKFSLYYPLLGLNAMTLYPRFSKSLSLSMGVSLSGMDAPETRFQDGLDIKFSSLVVTPSLGLKYAYTKFRLRPVLEAGIAYAMLLNSKSTVKDYKSETYYWIIDHELRKTFFGTYAGVGFDYVLKKRNYFLVRFSADFFTKSDGTEVSGGDKMKAYKVKLGYVFVP